MDTFLQNIGLSDTYSLHQGNELNQYMNSYKELNNIETMDTKSNEELQQLDIEFKDLLSKYTQALHSINEDLLKNTQTDNYNLLGKRFVTQKVDMYINGYGYGHSFTDNLEIDPSCPKKTDIFNNTCQGFSDTYLTKSKGGKNYMYFQDYKLKEGFVENTLIDKLKSCKEEDLKHLKENYKEYYALHFPNVKISEKTLDKIIQTKRAKCPDPGNTNYTLDGAKLHCNKETDCKGFSFTGDPKHSNPTTFSTKANISNLQNNKNWHTYLKGGDWGCAPEFSKNWWVKNKCTTNPVNSGKSVCNMDIKSIKTSSNMTNNRPCNVAGKIIRNSENNEIAWVDMQGNKHVFPDPEMRDKLDGCHTKTTISLKPTEYNAIPLGDPMTKESICQNINVDSTKYKNLLKLNKQLESAANKILLKLNTVASSDLNTEKDIMSKKSSIKSLLEKIKKERKAVDKQKQLYNIRHRQHEDSHTVYMSNNYHMIAWGLLVLAIGGFSIPVLLK